MSGNDFTLIDVVVARHTHVHFPCIGGDKTGRDGQLMIGDEKLPRNPRIDNYDDRRVLPVTIRNPPRSATSHRHLAVLVLLLIAVYWNTLRMISTVWNTPAYSHGWLVPVFAVVLLWMRREPIQEPTAQARWSGVAMLVAGLALRMVGGYFAYPYIEMVSSAALPVRHFLDGRRLAAIDAVVGSGSGLLGIHVSAARRSWSAGLLDPLQRVATICSTYALQTLGVAAHRSGNHIILGEAAPGRRRRLQRPADVDDLPGAGGGDHAGHDRAPGGNASRSFSSAVPIALLVNVIRITVTGISAHHVGTRSRTRCFMTWRAGS